MAYRPEVFYGDAYTFEKITVSNAAGGIGPTAGIGAASGNRLRAEAAYVTIDTQSIRYRLDGTAPDISTGHLVAAGGSFWVYGQENIASLLMIRATGADGVANVTYFA